MHIDLLLEVPSSILDKCRNRYIWHLWGLSFLQVQRLTFDVHVIFQVSISPNIGKHFARPWAGPAAKPCVLSDHSKGSRASSSTVQMARGEWLQGDPQVGLVKVYQLVPILTRTPGPQVGLYKAHNGTKWLRSEKLEPRIPPCVNLPIVV